MILTTLTFLLAAAAGANQDKGSVHWEVDESRLQVGEPAQMRLVFTNTPEPRTPEPAPVDGLTLTRVSDTPSTRQFTQIVNGRRTKEATYAYTFRVVGSKVGKVTIPAMTFDAGNRKFTSEAVTFEFADVPPPVANPGDELLFAKIDVDRTRLYVTQRFTATLRIGVRRLERQGATVDDRGTLIDYLRRQGKFELGNFADQKFEVQTRSLADAAGARHDYYVLMIQKEFSADQAGEMTVGPVAAFLDYPVQWEVRRSFFDLELNPVHTKRVAARAEAVALTVLAPPTEGRPADFTGAIGAFTMEVAAKPTEVERDQPVTLSIAIRGEPLEGVVGPSLASQPELSGRFDFRKEDTVGELVGDAKVIRQALFPRAEGPQTIPPLRWSYFDPKREAYVTLESKPVEINVLPSTGPPVTMSASSAMQEPRRDAALTVVSSGLCANVVDPALLLADQEWRVGAVATGLFAAPPIITAGVVVVQTRRRRRMGDKALARRAAARRRAETALRRASSAPDPSVRLDACAEALRGFLADRFDLPPGAITPDDARRVLATRSAPLDLVEQIAGFLRDRDAARFSGAAGELAERGAADLVRAWMTRIEGLTP